MRLVLFASSLALLAPAHARPPAEKPPAAVRAVVVSGDRQTTRSYVAPGTAAYLATFTKPLVVGIRGPGTRPNHPRHIVFTCEHCVFAVAEQGDLAEFVDRAKTEDAKDIPDAYDTRVDKGRAGIFVMLQAPVVAGTYRVRADPVPNAGERSVPTWFTLTTR